MCYEGSFGNEIYMERMYMEMIYGIEVVKRFGDRERIVIVEEKEIEVILISLGV